MRLSITLSLLLFFASNSFAQTVAFVDSTAQDLTPVLVENGEDNPENTPDLDRSNHPYGVPTATATFNTLAADNFNQGIVSDPLLLAQGKIAGVQIYNRGGDPNMGSYMRVRGISTFNGRLNPLFVIDGVIGASLDNVDPNDIAEITILKGAAAAMYGIRSGAGVVLITTKGAENRITSGSVGQWQISYHGQGGVSTLQRELPVMDRQGFLNNGGLDLGSDTKWMDEITQSGFNQVHGLSLATVGQRSTVRFSANYRSVEGILLNSGFEQFNARLQARTSLLNDRLKVSVNGAWTSRESNYSFPEAFRYAVLSNPTAPVFGDDAPYAFNSDQYGGYFQTVGLFDNFNPVSMVEQNSRLGERSIYNISGQLDYQLSDKFQVTTRLARQSNTNRERAIYPVTALFRGNASAWRNRGGADFLSSGSAFDLLEVFGTYQQQSDRLNILLQGGYTWQRYSNDPIQEAFFRGVQESPLDFTSSFDAPIGPNGAFSYNTINTPLVDEKLVAFFARAMFNWQSGLFFDVSLRQEGSSTLGEDGRWGTFPAINAGIDLNRSLQWANTEQLRLRVGYGLMGNLPAQVGLSQAQNVVSTNPDGSTNLQYGDRDPNRNLTWEAGSEWNVGLDWKLDRLVATVDFYTRKNRDLILRGFINPDANIFNGRYENTGELTSTGLELSLGYEIIKQEGLQWRTDLVLSTQNNRLDASVFPRTTVGVLGAPGQCCGNTHILEEGEDIGQLWGTVFTGVDADGLPLYADLNNDGQVLFPYDFALEENADFTTLGNGLPTWELGWGHQVEFGNWSVNAFFRGAFGHSLAHMYRMYYEPVWNATGINVYNSVNTELREPELESARYSSLYVEKADFLRLDNLTIGRRFAFGQDQSRSLQVYLTGQNLFVLTSYTGPDPEPALLDFGPVDNGGYLELDEATTWSPGIDRRYGFWPARTVLVGVKVEL